MLLFEGDSRSISAFSEHLQEPEVFVVLKLRKYDCIEFRKDLKK